ncbi:MAG: aminotransferase class V-fold PLP-dependent enzyme [Chloroflexota bacterium]
MTNTYDMLAVRRVINAAATLTKLGGSVMPPTVVAAMATAAGAFVDLHELQRRVGERIAALTHNEACYVSSGAAAGITLAVAACIAGTDSERMASFPYLDGRPQEVITWRSQRNGYQYAACLTGARLREIGATAQELGAACTEQTAAILWFAGSHFSAGTLPLEDVVSIAHEKGIPVLVDAAAQIPPIANLWRYTTELGADAAIFSGGKGLRGPQATGLVLGRRRIIDGCRANGNPNHAIGRPMKVGKEELAGILAAVEWTLAQDEPAVLAGYEAVVRLWLAGLADLPGVVVERVYPSEAGQPHSRAIIRLSPEAALTRDALVKRLWARDPRVAVGVVGSDAIALNPQTVQADEVESVQDAVRQELLGVSGIATPAAGEER